MKNSLLVVMFPVMFICTLCGCQATSSTPASLELSYSRGAQLLAAGNPKSAIPFLSQTVASSTPDDVEPAALLSLAFALDLQSEQAILQAQKVHRPADQPPGWEAVAVGIAETTRHRPTEAIVIFQHVLATVHADSPLIPATRQWLALAQIIKGDHDAALSNLAALSKCPSMKSSALLWTLLIRARDGQNPQAADALTQCAGDVTSTLGKPSYEGNLDDQSLYDSAITALAAGKLDDASQALVLLQKRDTDGGDGALWLALISAAQGHWQDAHNALDDACETGPLTSRGLANELCTVIRAMEDRPDSMIQHMLTGQRMMSSVTVSAHVIDAPEPENVWFSDKLK